MSVHYKFKSSVEYDTLAVDGVNISLGDLKDAIIQQKRLGRGQPYDLQVTNAETKEVYTDDKTLIPKNSSLIVARVPIDPSLVKKSWEGNKDATALLLANPANLMNTEDAIQAAEIGMKIRDMTDITKITGSEKDKINVMMAQSTLDYHPSRYVKLRNSFMSGKVPQSYKCYKCHQGGHWVIYCPLNNQDLRKSTGIPSKFLKEVSDPNTPGAMITATGKFVVFRSLSAEEKETVSVKDRPPPPDEFVCLLCKELLKDAVYTPCCANAFCDECIRNHLLDSEESFCASCDEKDVLPDTLIPCRYLRLKCVEFNNQCDFDIISKIQETQSNLTPPQSPREVQEKSVENSPEINKEINREIPTSDSPLLVSETVLSPFNKEKLEAAEFSRDSPVDTFSPKTEEIKDVQEMREKAHQGEMVPGENRSTHSDSDADSTLGVKHKHKKRKKKDGEKHEKKEKKEKREKKDKKKRKNKKESDTQEIDEDSALDAERKARLLNQDWPSKSKWDTTPEKEGESKSPYQRERHDSDMYNEAVKPVTAAPPTVPTYGSPSMLYKKITSVAPPIYSVPPPNYPTTYTTHEVIDDPLAAFEKHLREKDERKRLERCRRSRSRSRSYSRSRSRSLRPYRSRSRSPPPRRRRSPHSPRHHRSRSPNMPMHGREPGHYYARGGEEFHGGFHHGGMPNLSRPPPPIQGHHKPPWVDSEGKRPFGEGYGPRGRGRGGRRGMHLVRGFIDEGGYNRNYRGGDSYHDREGDRRYKDSSFKRYSSDEEMRQDDYKRKYTRHEDEKTSPRYMVDTYRRDGSPGRYKDLKRKMDRRSRSRSRSPKNRRISPREKEESEKYRYEKDYLREKREKDFKKSDRYGEERIDPDRNREYERRDQDKVRDHLDWSKDEESHERGTSSKDRISGSREKDIRSSDRSQDKKEESHSWSDIEQDQTQESESLLQKVMFTPPTEASQIPNVDKATEKEKKKHDKKKKKKEKRRNSQASTDASQTEAITEDDDKKKKKKEKKAKKLKENVSILTTEVPLVTGESVTEVEEAEIPPPTELPEGYVMPELSKWEREDEEIQTPKKFSDRNITEDKITTDVLKKAENAFFGSRSFTSHKAFMEAKKADQKLKTPSPDHDLIDTREAKRRGTSIQITISSKTESQIGRPKSKFDMSDSNDDNPQNTGENNPSEVIEENKDEPNKESMYDKILGSDPDPVNLESLASHVLDQTSPVVGTPKEEFAEEKTVDSLQNVDASNMDTKELTPTRGISLETKVENKINIEMSPIPPPDPVPQDYSNVKKAELAIHKEINTIVRSLPGHSHQFSGLADITDITELKKQLEIILKENKKRPRDVSISSTSSSSSLSSSSDSSSDEGKKKKKKKKSKKKKRKNKKKAAADSDSSDNESKGKDKKKKKGKKKKKKKDKKH